MKRVTILFLLLLAASAQSFAQCAMCRATLENNLSNGNPGIALGINFGILYLLFAPYFAIAVIAFFWYRTSKNNALRNSIKRHFAG
ncbi:MAG: hypothetical protein DI538_14585 [Azospira oryzae]|nr:MAG: hypothetical protein DI538_14585 [Azospira oryzae]